MKTPLIFGVALGVAGAFTAGAYAGSPGSSDRQSSQYERQDQRADDYYGYGRGDTERDSVLDLGDVRRSARDAFDEKKENGVVSLRDFGPSSAWERFRSLGQSADENLTRREFLSVIDEMFDEVDRNGNGVLDHDELNSPRGRALLRIIG
jgi:hypothetical protein